MYLMNKSINLDSYVKKIPNFPKEGILFYDVTPMLTNPNVFRFIIDSIKNIYHSHNIDGIAALEARGFYFGSAVALTFNKPFYPIRKAGKLPGDVLKQNYQLEYGAASIEMQVDSNLKHKNILIIDDLIATGGTLLAAINLLKRQGAVVSDLFGVVGLNFLNYKESLTHFHIKTLINYE